ncbi:MAG: hypothetical protein M3439_00855 [Chloroflexota bacterium]|nr:hypothetical protein [Chloroflexota bacterium]
MREREYSATRSRLSLIASTLLAAVASAGLVASTSSDLQNLTAFYLSDVLLLPGLVLIGVLIALANDDDVARSAVALLVAGVLGATIVGLAIAAPGFRVEGVQTTMIDRGTTFGLLALLLIVLFGLAGIVISWLAGAFLRPGRL